MRYCRSPVIVDAIQWTGDNLDECIEFLGDLYGGHAAERHVGGQNNLYIDTPMGYVTANKGDIIVEDAHGGKYPCDPAVFEVHRDTVKKD